MPRPNLGGKRVEIRAEGIQEGRFAVPLLTVSRIDSAFSPLKSNSCIESGSATSISRDRCLNRPQAQRSARKRAEFAQEPPLLPSVTAYLPRVRTKRAEWGA